MVTQKQIEWIVDAYITKVDVMIRFGLIVSAAILGVISSSVANHQPNCARRDRVVRHLSNTYAERTIAIGLTDLGGVIELFQSNDGKTWTIVTTMPDGISCQIAGGKYWEFLPRDALYNLSQ